jgi:hypothetical protein
MKKQIILWILLAIPLASKAQKMSTTYIDKEIFNVCATIFVIGIGMFFILAILKRMLDYRLKNKIVEKETLSPLTSSLLQASPEEDKNSNIKWFAILAGLGIGLTIIHYTLPLGIHSLAIMAFSLAGSFLGYFLFLKRSER